MNTHATFEDLIARKLARDERAAKIYEIPAPGLDKPLHMTHPTSENQLDVLNGLRPGADISDVVEIYVRLIHACCPALRARETVEGMGVVDPYDTVRAAFEPYEIIRIGDAFCEACGLIHIADQVKN